MIDPRALLERARRYDRTGRTDEAAAAYAEAAAVLEERRELPMAVLARAHQARALAVQGRTDRALEILMAAEQAAASLPPGPAGAELAATAAEVLAEAGVTGEAARRAWAAMAAFQAGGDTVRAEQAAVRAARLILRDAGRDAAGPLRDLLARLVHGGDAYRRVAEMLSEAERRPDRDHDVLITDPEAPAWGKLAHALAVGAHLAVGNGVPWNTLFDPDGPEENRKLLARDWDVTDPESWREQIDKLLDAENSDPAIQVVLDCRRPDTEGWTREIRRWCGERDISAKTVAALEEVADQVRRYEERFRKDGLLRPHGQVSSVYGYDFGRAVNMARWGLNAGYCDGEAAQDCSLTAGYRAYRTYDSWEEFSAGYILGRMLRFDDGEFGDWYLRSLEGHRILTTDPASPWRRMAWG
ncbi:DUF1266 domain-containing protein [Actinomadura rupiterrae]|uniref:DUF1266 domain-containing protein n=1 Tax=Actinomadura rupiterrae TaxID=559627 RepID=UPI0020A447B6|nr:DUF1266 domain-containing protein [Actinomadura rupiterrae]MCP2342320.1 tetratricopeptide (TPR) repeat protein [Actinomadura rupiterrae]